MKKILLLFILFLGLNVGAFAASEVQFFSDDSNADSPVWVFYKDDNGNWHTYDDGCSRATVIHGDDDVVFTEPGPC